MKLTQSLSTSPGMTSTQARLKEVWDGTQKVQRPLQSQALDWIDENYHKQKLLVMNLPTASGKSALARTIQRKYPNTAVITPSNLLIDQYNLSYSTVNCLKGKIHYECQCSGLSCMEYQEIISEYPKKVREELKCGNCPYDEAKFRAMSGEATFFNPLSFLALRGRQYGTIVVDEAHTLAGMLQLMSGSTFDRSVYRWPNGAINEHIFVEWSHELDKKLSKLLKTYQAAHQFKEAVKIMNLKSALSAIRQGLAENQQNYAMWIEKKKFKGRIKEILHVKPVKVPEYLVREIFKGADHIILMSGTMFKTDIAELFPHTPYAYLDLPSPIPKENRPILFRPVPEKMNYKTEPEVMATRIKEILAEFPGRNTIIHTTYSNSTQLIPFLDPSTHIVTVENKLAKIDEFKKTGGVVLASGCAEGIDLVGDLCRLNIIPKLVWPNLGDPVVKRRMALIDGELWYALTTIQTIIQQAGRSTRTVDDHSITVILDQNFARIVNKYRQFLPRYFLEAIVWTKQPAPPASTSSKDLKNLDSPLIAIPGEYGQSGTGTQGPISNKD